MRSAYRDLERLLDSRSSAHLGISARDFFHRNLAGHLPCPVAAHPIAHQIEMLRELL
jgi:hypothetical protein